MSSPSKTPKTPEQTIYCCTGSKCKKKGGKELAKSLKQLIKEAKLKGKVKVVKTGCNDFCKFAPVVSIQPKNEWILAEHEQTTLRRIQNFLRENYPS